MNQNIETTADGGDFWRMQTDMADEGRKGGTENFSCVFLLKGKREREGNIFSGQTKEGTDLPVEDTKAKPVFWAILAPEPDFGQLAGPGWFGKRTQSIVVVNGIFSSYSFDSERFFPLRSSRDSSDPLLPIPPTNYLTSLSKTR